MSDVIDFLGRMGQDSQLRGASGAILERALNAATMSPPLRAALVSGNRVAIEAILEVESNVCCLIHAPVEREEENKPHKTKEGSVEGRLRPRRVG
jgi:hypothetical protein